jgi:hypothetical protein
MQAQVRGYQCLACGAVTNDDLTPQITVDEGPNVNNAGVPIKELGDLEPVVLAPAGDETIHEAEPEVEAPEVVSEPEEEVTPEPEEEVELPLDIASLTPEQITELKARLAAA